MTDRSSSSNASAGAVQIADYFKWLWRGRKRKQAIVYKSNVSAVVEGQTRRRPCFGLPHDYSKIHIHSKQAQMVRIQKLLNSIALAEQGLSS